MTHSTGRWLEGAILVLMGAFIVWLIVSGNYWNYLNPKFTWLTGAAGAGMILAGLALPFDHGVRPGGSRMAVLLIFLALVYLSAQDMVRQRAEADLFFTGEKTEEAPSRIEWNGHEYTRINTAELLLLIDKTADLAGGRFAVQGVVTRGGELGSEGLTAMVRTAVVCCLADAIAMGFLLTGDQAAALPAGEWAEVLGVVEDMPRSMAGKHAVRIPGAMLTVLDEAYVLHVERATVINPPALPYIFEFREQEPFAY